MGVGDGRVRLWERALLNRYESSRLHTYYEWDQLRELDIVEHEVQEIFAEVGLVLAQLMQVEHGMNAVLRAEGSHSGSREPHRHRSFGLARSELADLVDRKCVPSLLESQLATLKLANVLRNHLVHGEVSVAIDAPSGMVAEVFWLDGEDTDVLDLHQAGRLANASLDAVVDIMLALELP